MKNIIIFLVFVLGCCIFFWGYRDYLYYQNFQNLYNSGSFSELTLSNTLEKKSGENYHNLGNAWYRFFEETTEIENLRSAVGYYSGSLQIEEHPDTRYNYELSSKLLEFLEQQDQKEEEEQETANSETPTSQGQESQDQEGESEGNNEGEQSGNQSDENTIKENRGEEYQIGSEDEVNEMTAEERALLEQELENIKNAQLYNQQFFGKQEQEGEFGNIFDSFFGRVDRGGEKDW